jgi:biotin transport system ATP-binding protein
MEILKVKNLIKEFNISENTGEDVSNGRFKALNDISFSLSQGDLCIIAGSNGAGKTLLMSTIAGLENKSGGEINIEGTVGLIFQDADAQILGETPIEDAALGPQNMKLPKEEVSKRAQEALALTGLKDKADYPARFLSGGEKKRLSIAAVLAMDTDILIFDEPYANLDFPSIKQINKLILTLKEQGKTIIILTHEIEKCLALSNRFIVMDSGCIVFDGTPEKGLLENLEIWGIRNPLKSYERINDLIWI